MLFLTLIFNKNFLFPFQWDERILQTGRREPSVTCTRQGPSFNLLPKLEGTTTAFTVMLPDILFLWSQVDSRPPGGATLYFSILSNTIMNCIVKLYDHWKNNNWVFKIVNNLEMLLPWHALTSNLIFKIIVPIPIKP